VPDAVAETGISAITSTRVLSDSAIRPSTVTARRGERGTTPVGRSRRITLKKSPDRPQPDCPRILFML
jgi:hypothetical protein